MKTILVVLLCLVLNSLASPPSDADEKRFAHMRGIVRQVTERGILCSVSLNEAGSPITQTGRTVLIVGHPGQKKLADGDFAGAIWATRIENAKVGSDNLPCYRFEKMQTVK